MLLKVRRARRRPLRSGVVFAIASWKGRVAHPLDEQRLETAHTAWTEAPAPTDNCHQTFTMSVTARAGARGETNVEAACENGCVGL